jgi:hypothetical protein
MPLIELTRFPDRIAAELARSRLGADGIDSVLFDEGFAVIGPSGLSSIRLMIAEEDRRSATASLGL